MPENTNKTTVVFPENLDYVLKAIYDNFKNIGGLTPKFVDILPDVGEKNILYLVPNGLALDQNVRNEYLWDAERNVFECVGTTAIDMSNYIQKSDLQPMTTDELDAMIAEAKGDDT